MDIPFSSPDSALALPLLLSLLWHVPPFVWPYSMLLIGHHCRWEWLIKLAYVVAIIFAVRH